MEWVNLHISTLASPESIGSSPAELGTWLRVLTYACTIECGGRIPGAKSWKDKQWVRACQVTRREIQASHRLLRFDGEDLMVNGYPAAKEAQVRQARGAGMAGAIARWGKDANGENVAAPMPVANAEGKGREGKGKEGHPTPPTIDEKVKNAKALRVKLRSLGELSSSDEAVREWGEMMAAPGIGQCVTLQEVLEGVAYLVAVCRRESIKVKYSKDVPVTIISRWTSILKGRDRASQDEPS